MAWKTAKKKDIKQKRTPKEKNSPKTKRPRQSRNSPRIRLRPHGVRPLPDAPVAHKTRKNKSETRHLANQPSSKMQGLHIYSQKLVESAENVSLHVRWLCAPSCQSTLLENARFTSSSRHHLRWLCAPRTLALPAVLPVNPPRKCKVYMSKVPNILPS